MSFKKILCPIDFSPCSKDALRVAVHLARRFDAELVVAHVWYMPAAAYAGEYPLPADAVQSMTEEAEGGLRDMARDAIAQGAGRVTTRLASGLPREQIVQILRADPAYDLVVMGTHGRTGFARILLGSVAEAVVRHAPCPVLAVRAGTEPGSFGHVLCPIDFSDSSRDAVAIASELASPSGAGITLLHVVELPFIYAGEGATLGIITDREQKSGQLLAQWAAELRTRVPFAVDTRLRTGSPGVQTLALVDDDPSIDLVVTGSHGRTGMSRMLLGSVAEKVVRHATCPVLVTHARKV